MKKNPMLAKIEEKYNALFHRKMDALMQMGQDAAPEAAKMNRHKITTSDRLGGG